MLYVETIELEKETVEKIQGILDIKEGYCPDYGRNETIDAFTAKFKNGFEADIKLCNADTPFIDSILNDEQGCEVYTPDVSYELLGKYEFVFENDTYELNLTMASSANTQEQ